MALSFMPPDDEYRAACLYSQFLFGRKEMDAVRGKARKAYMDLVCRIAATPCAQRTLRQALDMPDRADDTFF